MILIQVYAVNCIINIFSLLKIIYFETNESKADEPFKLENIQLKVFIFKKYSLVRNCEFSILNDRIFLFVYLAKFLVI